jgi:hypothetical protein
MVHGAFNLAAQINPGSVGHEASPDPGGIFRYATAGVALLVVGWLIVGGRPAAAGASGGTGSRRALPVRLGQLALLAGVVLVFTYVGRLYDFITPAHRPTLFPPLLYGLVLHPALYLWLGRLLAPPAAVPAAEPDAPAPADEAPPA